MYDHVVIPSTLSEVLSQSDFVSMHAPARPEVNHMLGEEHFRQMKKTAIFVNTGRGATVNEEALIKALQEGWIAHAALDVLEKEPPSHNNPMLSMEDVTLTAHVASAAGRFDAARTRCMPSAAIASRSFVCPLASAAKASSRGRKRARRWRASRQAARTRLHARRNCWERRSSSSIAATIR